MATKHEQVAQWQDALLPHVVDRLAVETPEAAYAEWVTGSSVVSINYAQLANIVNGLAWWLVDQLGGPGTHGPHPEVLTYVGPNDVRYGALVLAAVKAGYVLFVTSPRNSPAAHRALFDHLQCQTLITTDPTPPPARAILDAVKPRRHLTVPSVEHFLADKHPAYVLNKSFKEVQDDPFVMMHTSGTTGMPKPIIWTHKTCNTVLNAKTSETPRGMTSVEGSLVNGKRVIVTLPPFHGALLAQLVVGAIPFGNVVIAPVAAAIPTAQGVVDALKQSPADVAILVPSVVAELAHNPELLDYCATYLESILYIGGDLPQDLGDRVAAKIYLRCLWGATETGIVPQLLPPELLPSSADRSLWRYVRFHPCIGPAFEETTEGIYEFVVKRDKALVDTQACFTVPGLNQLETGYRTKDLFEPHPTIADLWVWRGRADDIIVFLNGEKTNPISFEQHVMASNPELSGALVIGAQRFQAALLIESASESTLSTAEQAALIERVWPSVEQANRSAPAHARVEKSFILVVPADRRLIRAGKGTFVRGPSISQYTEEIEKLYGNADVVPDTEDDGFSEAGPRIAGPEAVARLVRQQLRAVTGWSSLQDDDSFFDHGMDSLQGLQLTRALRRTFRRPDLALSTIYKNSTVSLLAAAILTGDDSEVDDRKVMGNLLATYRGLVEQIPAARASSEGSQGASKTVHVLLTGSTGTVGTQLLRALLDREGIGRIFCLNRREDGGKSVQQKKFITAGFATTELDDDQKVTFVKAELHLPQLGLDSPTYELLQSKVGLIIHAAWPVNFNMTLSAFRPQLAGLVNLLSLSASTTAASPRFVFISSVAAVEGYPKSGPPPEAILDDFDVAAPIGYGRAKLLGELLLNAAARHLEGIAATVIRVGQVAGPVRRPGLWNPQEWLPSLVLSSLYLGQVPDSPGPLFNNVDFVPVDLLADVLIDLATSPTAGRADDGGANVFNVRNPNLTPWATLLPAVTTAGDGSTSAPPAVHVVSPATWLASLRASSQEESSEDVEVTNPALKLLDFYEALWPPATDAAGTETQATEAASSPQNMAVDQAVASSPSLRSLEPVSLEWMRKWTREWIALRNGGKAG